MYSNVAPSPCSYCWKPSVLITAYNKPSRLISLINLLWSYGFHSIYIQFDGARTEAVQYLQDSAIDVLSSLSGDQPSRLHISQLPFNMGGPVAIPYAINQFFANSPTPFLLILEEDLFFTSDPSQFLASSLSLLGGSLLASCLTTSFSASDSHISPYFDPWGWMISSDGWSAIRSIVPDRSLLANALSKSPFSPHRKAFWLDIFDKIYIREGSFSKPRHWDYDITLRAIQSGFNFLYPSSSFVVNLGGCSRSQNTSTVPLQFRVSLPTRHITSSTTYPCTISPAQLDYSHNARHRPPRLQHLFREALRRIGFQRLLHSVWLLLVIQRVASLFPSLYCRLRVFQDPSNGEALLFGSSLHVSISSLGTTVPGYLSVYLPSKFCLPRDVVQYSPLLLSSPSSLASILLPDSSFSEDSVSLFRAFSNYFHSLRPGGILAICLSRDVISNHHFFDLNDRRLYLDELNEALCEIGFVPSSCIGTLADLVCSSRLLTYQPCLRFRKPL